MNIQTILQHIDAFPPAERGTSGFDPVGVLSGIYCDALGLQEYDYELFNPFVADIDLRPIFDFSYGGEDYAWAQIVTLKGTPFAIVTKSGSRDEATIVVNEDVFLELGKALVIAQAERALTNKLRDEDAPTTLHNSYLVWVDPDAGLFSVNHPRLQFRFADMVDRYAAVVQAEDGTVHRVKALSFAVPGRYYDLKSEERDIASVELVGGGTRQLNASSIVFSLLPVDVLELAQQSTATETCWEFVQMATPCVVRVVQYRAGVLGRKAVSAFFRNRVKLDQFVAEHKEGRYPGVFDALEHGGESMSS